MPDRYRVLVLVAGYGGFRWSELVGLRRSSIDGARVLVAEQLQQVNGAWLRDTPKSASSRRVVTLPASVAAELAGHLEEFSQVGPDGLVFVNRLGNPVGPSFRGNVWYPACARAGLATRTHRPGRRPLFVDGPDFHDLRHTAVALSISAGAHPKTIQSMLGHSSIAVTMNTYGHLLEGVESSLADDLDRMRPRPDAAG
jgi:integrase